MRSFAILSALFLTVSASAFDYSWKLIPVDSHITGVTTPAADNASEALGFITHGSYKSPSGRVFCGGSVRNVARIMIEAQPSMAYVKQVLGVSDALMETGSGERALFDMIADCIKNAFKDSLGVGVDLVVMNKGGVRVDMPEGKVTYDDILSMLPFNNKLVAVRIKGKYILPIFESMAVNDNMFYSGARMRACKDGRIISLEIDGKKIDPKKEYMLGTVDFLYNGGDGFTIADEALSASEYSDTSLDFFLPFVKSFAERGIKVGYIADGRYIIE